MNTIRYKITGNTDRLTGNNHNYNNQQVIDDARTYTQNKGDPDDTTGVVEQNSLNSSNSRIEPDACVLVDSVDSCLQLFSLRHERLFFIPNMRKWAVLSSPAPGQQHPYLYSRTPCMWDVVSAETKQDTKQMFPGDCKQSSQ